MKFDIKEVLVAGDRVVVRGEVTGTPAGELFGVPHTGKSFRIIAIDRWENREDVSHGELVECAGATARQAIASATPK
jgi:predicted ester cyclase